MRKLSKFEKIFITITKIYVKNHPAHSFTYTFDNIQYPQIGDSKNNIKVTFHNSESVFTRIFTEGSLGLGESYCEGNIEVDDLDYKHFMMIFVKISSNKRLLLQLPLADIYQVVKAKLTKPPLEKMNQSENINTHYSLSDWFENEEDSNTFYLYWLNSKYIQYTCAKWDPTTKNLEEAQKNKFEFYAKRLGIDKTSKNKTLLDLGCGWGGFMFYLAETYGLKCTGLTLSNAQVHYIEEESKKRKLTGRVDVIHENAHNMTGTWDYIISIGLLEHIDDYDDLYSKTAKSLDKNGKALFHAIHHEHSPYIRDTFLDKYIFPGGATPNIYKNVKILKKYFSLVERNDLPKLSYPKTLDCWYRLFCKNQNKIKKLLQKKGRCKDPDYAIRIFKHYLTLSESALTNSGLVSNILVYN
tara:strand:+ start:3403 stop:4638 length:1236 start_codon:yes stop_codon:yes gene_type:complete